MLYLKDVKREDKDSLYTFLKRCIGPIPNSSYKSIGGFPTTYTDKECTNKECSPKFRSLEVIIEISKAYFRVSDKQVAKALKKLCVQDKILGLLLCKTANKWIFYNSKNAFSYVKWYADEDNFILDYNNSINKKDQRGVGKYTYNEIRELMDN